MHPILKERKRLALYLLAWLPPAALLAAALRLASGVSWAEALGLAVPACLLHAFICLASWYVVRAHPIARTPVERIVTVLSAGALVSTAAWCAVIWIAGEMISRTSSLTGIPFVWVPARQLPILAAAGLLLYLLVAAFHYLLASFEEARRAERRLLELSLLSREAELKWLRAQIDPHFLFNALNSIASLTHRDPEGARGMCATLGDFFRESLRLGGQQQVPLSQELALTRSFLAIERIRFGDRLRVEETIGPGCGECLVPPLLLQPLIENAVRHGIATMVSGGVVRLEASRDNRALRLAVENPREEDAPSHRPRPGAGVGLENVRLRLSSLYGADAAVHVASERGRFRVELTLPASSIEDRKEPKPS